MKLFRGIARKLILRILALGFIFTLISSIFHAFQHYNNHANHTSIVFDHIQKTHIKTVADNVWVANTDMLNTLLKGIAGYPNIQYIELLSPDIPPLSYGIKKENSVEKKSFAIDYIYKNEKLDLGSLTVYIDTEYLFKEVFIDAVSIFTSEAIIIFCLSASIIYFFYNLVGRHLTAMAKYTRIFDLKNSSPLTLQRQTEEGESIDELDQLAISINQMRQNILDDIEKKTLIEKKLYESERHYRELVENTGDLITTVDAAGILTSVNRKAEEIFGYAAAQLIGMSAFQFVHPDDRGITQNWFNQCINARTKQDNFENRQINMTNKKIFHMLWTCNFHYDNDGELSFVSGVAHDITERKQNEANSFRMKKIEATGVLAGGIAHDFNNLLAVIQGYADLAKNEVEPGSPVSEMLTQVEDASRRAVDLTKKFITFSTGGVPDRKVFSIIKTIENILKDVLDEDIQYKISAAHDLMMVYADPKQIKQAFSNIIINAKESMNNGGSVQVKLDNASTEDVLIRTGQNCKHDHYILVSISDQGCGVPESDLPKIFDPYFSTKARGSQKGMGLGLSITSSIINRHDGFIFVNSKINSGTTVSIFIPAVAPPGKGLKENESPKTANKKNAADHKKILVMDDEKMFQNMIKQQLESFDYQVETAINGEEAIAIFSAAADRQDNFSLVILDLKIKEGMGGKDTLIELQKIDPEVKAIACSGLPDDEVLSNYESFGFLGKLEKPFSKEDLIKALAKLSS